MTSAPFSPSRLPFFGSLSLVATIALSAGAQGGSPLDGPGNPSSFMLPTGAALSVVVLDSNENGMTLQARPERPADKHSIPLSFSALIGVPPGSLLPVEVRHVEFIPGGGEDVQAVDWKGRGSTDPSLELASLEVLGWLRHQRVARLVIRPWMIEPQASESARLRSITLRINFATPVGSGPGFPIPPPSSRFCATVSPTMTSPGATGPRCGA